MRTLIVAVLGFASQACPQVPVPIQHPAGYTVPVVVTARNLGGACSVVSFESVGGIYYPVAIPVLGIQPRTLDLGALAQFDPSIIASPNWYGGFVFLALNDALPGGITLPCGCVSHLGTLLYTDLTYVGLPPPSWLNPVFVNHNAWCRVRMVLPPIVPQFSFVVQMALLETSSANWAVFNNGALPCQIPLPFALSDAVLFEIQ